MFVLGFIIFILILYTLGLILYAWVYNIKVSCYKIVMVRKCRSHCDKNCFNMKMSQIIIVTMLHCIVSYSMLHCYITKIGFNTRVTKLGHFNIWFIILKFNIAFIIFSIMVYNINPLHINYPP